MNEMRPYKFVLRNKRKTENAMSNFEVLESTPRRSVRSRRRSKRHGTCPPSSTNGINGMNGSTSSTPSPTDQNANVNGLNAVNTKSNGSTRNGVTSATHSHSVSNHLNGSMVNPLVNPLQFSPRRVLRRQQPVTMPKPIITDPAPQPIPEFESIPSNTVKPIKILQRPRQIHRVIPVVVSPRVMMLTGDYRKVNGLNLNQNLNQNLNHNLNHNLNQNLNRNLNQNGVHNVNGKENEQKMPSPEKSSSESQCQSPYESQVPEDMEHHERKQDEKADKNSIAINDTNHINDCIDSIDAIARQAVDATVRGKQEELHRRSREEQRLRKRQQGSHQHGSHQQGSHQQGVHQHPLNVPITITSMEELSDSEAEVLSPEAEEEKFGEFLKMLDGLDTGAIFNEIVGDRKQLKFPKKKSLVIYESSSVWDPTINHDNSSWDTYFKSARHTRPSSPSLMMDEIVDRVIYPLKPFGNLR